MAYEQYSKVALKVDLPPHRLRRGDVAIVVDSRPARPGQEPGYYLEVFNAVGESIAVLMVDESQIKPLTQNEILHARRLDEAPS